MEWSKSIRSTVELARSFANKMETLELIVWIA